MANIPNTTRTEQSDGRCWPIVGFDIGTSSNPTATNAKCIHSKSLTYVALQIQFAYICMRMKKCIKVQQRPANYRHLNCNMHLENLPNLYAQNKREQEVYHQTLLSRMFLGAPPGTDGSPFWLIKAKWNDIKTGSCQVLIFPAIGANFYSFYSL